MLNLAINRSLFIAGIRDNSLRATSGFTDGANCSGGGGFVINFSGLASFTDQSGVGFINITTGDTASLVTSGTSSPNNQINYTVSWVGSDPLAGEEIRYLYDSGLGNYLDANLVAMEDQDIRLTNCLDVVTTNQIIETGTTNRLIETGTTNTIVETA